MTYLGTKARLIGLRDGRPPVRGFLAKSFHRCRNARDRVLWRLSTSQVVGGALARAGIEPILVLGDSHMRPVNRLRQAARRNRRLLHVVSVSGATASGLSNPNSSTNASQIFRDRLRRIKSGQRVVVGLGEVDVGFLVYLRADQDGGSVRSQTTRALSRFFIFLEQEVVTLNPELIVIGTIAPTVEDYQSWPGLDGLRAHISATRSERLQEARHWNRRCQEWCDSHGAQFVDTLEATLGNYDEIVPRYVNKLSSDHHLDPASYIELVRPIIAKKDWSDVEPMR